MTNCPHWCVYCIDFLYSKLLQHVLDIFPLTYKCAILHLFDLQYKEVAQLTNHIHIKFMIHHLKKNLFNNIIFLSINDVINIYLTSKQIISKLLVNGVVFSLLVLNPFGSKKFINLLYHALGPCFNQYNVFLSLYTWLGFLQYSKSGDCSTNTSPLMYQLINSLLMSL
jgi:hypothetical protein